MAAKKKNDRLKGSTKDITLRDVVVHMEYMEQQLSSDMKGMEQRLSSRIEKNTVDIQANTVALHNLDQRLTGRIDSLEVSITALGEDLTATMDDAFRIRKHVGMVTRDNA